MLAVAKLTGSALLPRWVTFCAVASIGLGISVTAETGGDATPEVSVMVLILIARFNLQLVICHDRGDVGAEDNEC